MAEFTVWLTGLPGSGKSTVAGLLAQELKRRHHAVEILDGDLIREELNRGLGFSREDRDENVRRIGWICSLLNRHDVIAVVPVVSPYASARAEVRARLPHYVEVYMCCPLEILVARDTKGLYRRALSGEIANFTGVSDPYERPINPDVTCYSDGRETPFESAFKVLAFLCNTA